MDSYFFKVLVSNVACKLWRPDISLGDAIERAELALEANYNGLMEISKVKYSYFNIIVFLIYFKIETYNKNYYTTK